MILWTIVPTPPLPPWCKTPLITNTCINTVKNVGVGSGIKGGEQCCTGKKPKMWVFDRCCFILINVFFGNFFALFCLKFRKIPFILSNYNLPMQRIVYFDKFKSNFCVLHISYSPATIAYPCNTPILFIRIPILLSGLLLLGYVTSWE